MHGLHGALVGVVVFWQKDVLERAHLIHMVSWRRLDQQKSWAIGTYQEQRVSQACVDKQSPAHPAAGTLAPIEDLRHRNRHNNPHELVAAVGHKIQQLRLVGDIQEIAPYSKGQNFQNHHHDRDRSDAAEQLGFELASEAGKKSS